jgi:hypothetical protein
MRCTLATLLSAASVTAQGLSYAGNSVPTVRESEAVAANFPDKDVDIYSPAFLMPDTVPDEFTNGTMGPTSQDILEDWLESLAARNEWMEYITPNFTSEEGRSIPYIRLSSSPSHNETGKLRIYIHGAVHGNEPGGDQAVMAFLGALDANQTYASTLLSAADFLIVPRYNPDGVAYFQRYLATSFDPNRDHVKLMSQQTRDIKAMNIAFDAHVSVDCHEFGTGVSRPYGGANGTYLALQDGQFSQFKNLNIHPDIRGLAESLFAHNIAAAMDAQGLRHSPYVVAPAADEFVEFITDNNGDDEITLSQGISILSETRGIGLGDAHFKRRTLAGLTIISAVVQTAIDNAEEVLRVIEDAREDYIDSDEEIIVTSHPNFMNITWPFIAAENGSIVEVPISFGNNTIAVANLTRPRPEAYVFSGAWAGVADKLRAVGVEVEVVPEAWSGEVEAFNVTSASLAKAKFEGVAQTVVETETLMKNVSFPSGAFWVPSRQRRAAHAFMRLEPEAESSFATWNVLPVKAGDEYPVYRVPRE